MTTQEIDNLVTYINENLEVEQIPYFIGQMKTVIENHPQGAEIADMFEHAGITITGIPCKRHPEA